eukprot:79206-Chlamydomonas_euryale.AAC.1
MMCTDAPFDVHSKLNLFGSWLNFSSSRQSMSWFSGSNTAHRWQSHKHVKHHYRTPFHAHVQIYILILMASCGLSMAWAPDFACASAEDAGGGGSASGLVVSVAACWSR